MPTFLVKLTHPETGETCIVDWSTVSDGPRSRAIPRESLRDYIRVSEACRPLGYYGEELARRELVPRLARLDETGCSSYGDMTAEDAISGNRAGPGEKELNERELFEQARAGGDPEGLDLLLRGLLVDLLEVLTNWDIPREVFVALTAKLSDEVAVLADIEEHLLDEHSQHADLLASLKSKAARLQALAEG